MRGGGGGVVCGGKREKGKRNGISRTVAEVKCNNRNGAQNVYM